MVVSYRQTVLDKESWTDKDWTIHSLNIHGTFFECWCEKIVKETSPWKVRATQYPVEFPPPNGPWRGKESVVDIIAEMQSNNLRLTMPIECKKNNPQFTDWIFFESEKAMQEKLVILPITFNQDKEGEQAAWEVKQCYAPFIKGFTIGSEARETRGDYIKTKNQDKTRTSNTAITEAANQIALGTQTLFTEDAEYSKLLAKNNTSIKPFNSQYFLPAIVTTANLHVCSFDHSQISASTGEIPLDAAKLKKIDYLFYQFPLPRHLQISPEDKVSVTESGNLDAFIRMNIIVINSNAFNKALDEVAALVLSASNPDGRLLSKYSKPGDVKVE